MALKSGVEALERGVRGTEKTIDRMHWLVQRAKLDPTIQKIAYWVRLGSPDRHRSKGRATADAVFHWVKRHGLFTSDPFQIEKLDDLVASMEPVAEFRAAGKYRGPASFVGDCDAYACWVAALGGVLGFMYAFETVKVDRDRPDEFSHVYAALYVDGDWYALDPSTPASGPGWRPPVPPDLLRRWPEGRIEDVVGEGGMSSHNGNGRHHGNGHGLGGPEDAAAFFPRDEYGYGIPKSFGREAEGYVPTPVDGGDMQLLPPHDTEPSKADLESDMTYIRARKELDPSERVQRILGQPDDHGNPYRAPRAQRYLKVERSPYPPGSKWNGVLGRDVGRFQRPRGAVQKNNPETPERQVRVVVEQPMAIRRRTVVMTTPERVPGGTMGDVPGLVTSYTEDPAAKAAASAGSSVWDTVSSVFSSVAKVAGAVIPEQIKARAASAVASATNRLAGQPVASVGPAPRPFWQSPVFWGAAALAGGAGLYALNRRGGGRRRR